MYNECKSLTSWHAIKINIGIFFIQILIKENLNFINVISLCLELKLVVPNFFCRWPLLTWPSHSHFIFLLKYKMNCCYFWRLTPGSNGNKEVLHSSQISRSLMTRCRWVRLRDTFSWDASFSSAEDTVDVI